MARLSELETNLDAELAAIDAELPDLDKMLTLHQNAVDELTRKRTSLVELKDRLTQIKSGATKKVRKKKARAATDGEQIVTLGDQIGASVKGK